MSYSAYKLTEKSRAVLLGTVPAVHSKVIADHITYKFPAYDLPPKCSKALVLFAASDDKVQAVGVSLMYHDQNTNAIRPDGGMFHVTISVSPENGGKPVMSNKMLKTTEGSAEFEPFEIDIEAVVL